MRPSVSGTNVFLRKDFRPHQLMASREFKGRQKSRVSIRLSLLSMLQRQGVISTCFTWGLHWLGKQFLLHHHFLSVVSVSWSSWAAMKRTFKILIAKTHYAAKMKTCSRPYQAYPNYYHPATYLPELVSWISHENLIMDLVGNCM